LLEVDNITYEVYNTLSQQGFPEQKLKMSQTFILLNSFLWKYKLTTPDLRIASNFWVDKGPGEGFAKLCGVGS